MLNNNKTIIIKNAIRDTNPRLTLTHSLSTGDCNLDHFTCRRRYVTIISTLCIYVHHIID